MFGHSPLFVRKPQAVKRVGSSTVAGSGAAFTGPPFDPNGIERYLTAMRIRR